MRCKNTWSVCRLQLKFLEGVMKEDRMDVEPCYPLFSAELESAEALASFQYKF